MFSSAEKKEGYTALFFLIIAYLLALKCASSEGLLVWWTACFIMLSVSAIFMRLQAVSMTPVVIAAGFLVAIIFLQSVARHELLSSVDLLIGGWMLIGLLIGLLLPCRLAADGFRYLVLIFGLLAIWGLVQHHFGTAYIIQFGNRANSIFTTPNSFAAGLNLVNIVLVALFLCGRVGRSILAVILLLFAALLASESRGGWVAFSGAMILLVALFVYFRQALYGRRLAWLTAGLVFVLAAHIGVKFMPAIADTGEKGDYAAALGETVPLAGMASSGGHRLQLYADAWQLVRERPWTGHGYMTFGDHYGRVQSGRYDTTVHFVHNDYLQHWAEIGLVGLIALLGLIAAFYYQAFNYRATPEADSRPVIIGLVAAMSSYLAHALVDFVFYIPALFIVAAGYAGYVNHLTCNRTVLVSWNAGNLLSPRFAAFMKVLLVLIPGWLLFEPALAQVAFQAGQRMQKEGRYETALRLFALAREFAPNEPEHYREEARYWLGEDSGVQPARKLENAVKLYQNAAENNPFDLGSRYQLAYLNVHYRHLLPAPAAPERIREWLGYIREMRPWDRELVRSANDIIKRLDSAAASERQGVTAGRSR